MGTNNPIAYMSKEELQRLAPEEMAETILNDNFDRDTPLARGMALNLRRDILDCLAATVERTAQAASASACPECARGGVPEYHEDWMGWYHGKAPCAGTSIRHAIRVALP